MALPPNTIIDLSEMDKSWASISRPIEPDDARALDEIISEYRDFLGDEIKTLVEQLPEIKELQDLHTRYPNLTEPDLYVNVVPAQTHHSSTPPRSGGLDLDKYLTRLEQKLARHQHTDIFDDDVEAEGLGSTWGKSGKPYRMSLHLPRSFQPPKFKVPW
jgi:hypothetical protein